MFVLVFCLFVFLFVCLDCEEGGRGKEEERYVCYAASRAAERGDLIDYILLLLL